MGIQTGGRMQLLVAVAALALAATQAAAQCTNTPATTPQNAVNEPWDCFGKTTQLNEVCSLRCLPGYTSSPAVTRTCIGKDKWSAAVGRCTRVCPGSPSVSLIPLATWPAECDSKVGVNNWCYGSCEPGYTGNPRTRCDGNGWSGVTLGKCVNASIVCRNLPPTNPANSAWPASCLDDAPGMSCVATCNRFYTTPNAPTAVCGPDGNWGPTTGGCHKVCTGKPTVDVPYATWPEECADSIRVSAFCTGTCAPGYTGKPRVMCGGSLPRQGPGGVWTDTVFGGCVADRSSPKVCPAPPADGPTNGKWPASCTYASAGSNCTAKCNTGYTSTPAPVMTCQADGTWSGVLSGTCEQVCTETPKAQLLDIGTWPSSCANTKLGGSCEASCPAPYNGSPEVKCTASGWDTGVVGRCRNNTKVCPNPPTQTITNSNPGLPWPVECADSVPEETCVANCKDGFTAITPAPTATCQVDGTWSSAATTTCQPDPTNCPALVTAAVSNASWPQNCQGSNIGQKCQANCDAGYTGTPMVACLKTGLWETLAAGTCTDVNACTTNPCQSGALCTDLPPPALNAPSGRTCACGTGFFYNYTTEACEVVRCADQPTAAVNGSWAACAGAASGTTCNATCGAGYTGDVTVKCLPTGQWESVASGVCTDVDACVTNPCKAPFASCQDKPAAAGFLADTAGRECKCSGAFDAYNETAGCYDVDACLTAPCGPGATCVDTPNAPVNTSGRSCLCGTGTFYANDTAGCQDFDSCAGNNPCAGNPNSDGTCIDMSAPLVGFKCGCNPGFVWNESACLDIDSCSPNPCTVAAFPNTDGVCRDKPAPNVGFDCDCSAGYTWNTTSRACEAIDACVTSPCSQSGDATTTCTDKPGTAGADPSGRECSCPSGYAYTEANGCKNIDACLSNACSQNTSLIGQLGNLANATCTDNPANSTNNGNDAAGRTCSCGSPGLVYTEGVGCTDIDACLAFPCLSPATCSDKLAGANDTSGRECTCAAAGSEYNATMGCVDIDACATNPCGPDATCQDKPGAPGNATGRECTCSAGKTYAGDVPGCIDTDSCAGDPCVKDANSTGTCVDKKAPLDGFSCVCKPGYEWNEKAAACTDINGCDVNGNNPCLSDAGSTKVCRDVAAPDVGYTCECSTGYFWEASSCADINACVKNACKDSGAGNVKCSDKGLGFPDTPEGRQCSCDAGYAYDEANGCQNIDACVAFTCSVNTDLVKIMASAQANCTDNPPSSPQSGNNTAGRTCTCGAGLTYVEGTGCTDINGCSDNPCASIANTTNCIDAVAPETGFSCGCTAGREWKNGQCVDIDGCAASPCTGVTSATGCKDKPAPLTGYECTCDLGRAWNGSACADVDACIGVDCEMGGTCVDEAAPSTGFTCNCGPGTFFNAAKKRCQDINGCAGGPCGSIAQAIAGTCKDIPAPNTGFTCECAPQVTADGRSYSRVWDSSTQTCLATACPNNVNRTCPDGAWPQCRGTAVGQVCTCNCNPGFDPATAPQSMCIRRPNNLAFAEWSAPLGSASCQRLSGRKLMSEWSHTSPKEKYVPEV